MNAYLDSRGQTTKNQVRNLGVILETDLSFSSHFKAVTKSAYYHLKNIARIRCFVSSQDLEKLVHAFITSRVDYCNGLLTGLPKKTIMALFHCMVRHGTVRYGSLLGGFPLGTVPGT